MNVMQNNRRNPTGRMGFGIFGYLSIVLLLPTVLFAFTLEVRDADNNPVNGYRWLVEEDNTNQPIPGLAVSNSLAVDIHKSHAPVITKGHTAGSTVDIDLPANRRYFVSVLPDAGHTMSGTSVALGQASATVIVNAYPVPTAQVSVLVFHDIHPINNAPEIPTEAGLEGFSIIVSDIAGQQMMDAFGNPLGTTYTIDGEGNPVVEMMGNGVVKTNTFGEALIKFLPPGKFGIQIVPPAGENWVQTTTIEGTPTIDAWVKANEPPVFVEFGPASYHVFVGFVKAFDDLAGLATDGGQSGSLAGRLVYNHFGTPPNLQGFNAGAPVDNGWIGLNEAFSRRGVYAAPANEDSRFNISGIPAGTYQLVTWDKNLDAIFGFNSVTIPDAQGNWNIDLGDVLCFAWFGTLQGSVFFDMNENGFRDPGEMGIPEQMVNIRFRDGTLYQAQPTDHMGEYGFSEVFPFFKWLVTEVDFARFKATGATSVVDAGGPVPADAGWDMPSRGKLNPQPQAAVNPNTGNNLSRTETGPVLTQAMHLFLGQANIMDWGKANYGPDESGGISGIIYYAITRAEDDPAYAFGEDWEPGIPRVVLNLYLDQEGDGVVDDVDGDGQHTLADRDNWPFGWAGDSAAKGPEDVDWNNNGYHDTGDAIQITMSDSWDDDAPSGCIQNIPVVHGQPVPECFDNFGTWNQLRPGVFDGGFAFDSYFPGGIVSGNPEVEGLPPGIYIVEAAVPPGYENVKEEDKNVDYGDIYIPALGGMVMPAIQIPSLPPPCVGDTHTVPEFLSLFNDIPAPYALEDRPLCDRKQVAHAGTQNTAVNFFFFTEVPKAARAVGFINNDLAAEFDQSSPVYGEKQAPAWIPISFQDYHGNEITRVYCDEFGAYNALLPSTYTVNIAAPSGVSPQMISIILNHPGPIPDPNNPGQFMMDPYFDPSYSQTPYTFNFEPGRTTYLDTPVIPVAAFAGNPDRALDAEPPDGTPMIASVVGPSGGPLICTNGSTVTITSLGPTAVPNPALDPVVITRDYGFGGGPGEVTVGGVPLTITSWSDAIIEATVDTDLVSTGHLLVTRANGLTSPIGVTLHVGDCDLVTVVTGGGNWPNTPIQDAIDTADPGTLILVGPGTYRENVIVYKNVKLQGAGAGATVINGSPIPFERVTVWHAKINALIAEGDLVPVDPEEAERFFEATEAPCILVHGQPETFDADTPGLIDGFTIMGGIAGGAIYVDAYADYLQISNNKITNNQGSYGGGITVGVPDLEVAAFEEPGFAGLNHHLQIRRNMIIKNGGINGGGGITLFGMSNHYLIADNFIVGNFSRNVGGGVAHLGLSDNGVIARNIVAFNEVFFGGEIGGEGGGIYIGGVGFGAGQIPGGLTAGAGSVSIVSNLIQGNLAGSGSGGGIRAIGINGQDVQDLPPEKWYSLNLLNNFIVNNVAALRGGGLALQDTVNANIVLNTIANNDATATAALAFPPGGLMQSMPQGAGLTVTPHSPPLAALIGQTYSSPRLLFDIFWHNRSFYWDNDVLVPHSPVYWDLQVVGGGQLNPQFSILTDSTGYDDSNISQDPLFVQEYFNTLLAAAVWDEGGNFITVRYPELGVELGDYHVQNGSPVILADTVVFDPQWASTQTVWLTLDIDGDPRTLGMPITIGADIAISPAVPNPVPGGTGGTGGSPTVAPPSDAQDMCPDDPNKTEPGTCGCGVADTDTDDDGIPDCLDQCPDTPPDVTVDKEGCPIPVDDNQSALPVEQHDNSPPAVNEPAPTDTTDDPETAPPVQPNSRVFPTCGLGSGQMLAMSLFGLLVQRLVPRRRLRKPRKKGVIPLNRHGLNHLSILLICSSVLLAPSEAGALLQCPPDTDGADTDGDGIVDNDHVCLQMAAGDGFINMADGRLMYMFGFSNANGLSEEQIMMQGMVAAEFPAPTIVVKEGQKLYLNLTNVGMMMRPDLFDPHTIHWHGFPNAAPIFDGVPDASISINMGATLTYFYNVIEPGTYMWHCHVEATEHMQMGMLGNLYVLPMQNNLPEGTDLKGFTHHAGYKYAYNDGDGSTYYDVEYPIQMSSFDPAFHDASINVQPLPFANMRDTYAMLNGRGYPDTVNSDPLLNTADEMGLTPRYSQKTSALITAAHGQKILLRISSLSVTRYYTLTALGIPMNVVARGARLLRGPDGKNLSYQTNSVNLGGGEAIDVILDTSQVSPGTYFLYTTNLHYLCNDTEDYGGMMTEIVITP